jgi:formate dehydrogenase
VTKIVCVLYDDPIDGYPTSYARDDLPQPERYPDGQTLPTPKGIDFKPGALLGSVSGELGLRKYVESNGHQLVVTLAKTAQTVFSTTNYMTLKSSSPNRSGQPT